MSWASDRRGIFSSLSSQAQEEGSREGPGQQVCSGHCLQTAKQVRSLFANCRKPPIWRFLIQLHCRELRQSMTFWGLEMDVPTRQIKAGGGVGGGNACTSGSSWVRPREAVLKLTHIHPTAERTVSHPFPRESTQGRDREHGKSES